MTETAPPPPAPQAVTAETWHYLQWLFAYQLLTVRQQVLTLSQKYDLHDEFGQPRFFVVRPPKLALNMAVGVISLAVNLLILVVAIRILMTTQSTLLALALIFGGNIVTSLIRVLLAPFRDIDVYTDSSERFRVLRLTQDNKLGLHYWFTIYDAQHQPVARARRHALAGIFRRSWTAETMDGRRICRVQEDALMLALLRRYFGTLWGLLRTNFDVLLPDGRHVGEYNRKLTLTDQYVLDLRADPDFLVDRRVTLALAILLDSAEGR